MTEQDATSVEQGRFNLFVDASVVKCFANCPIHLPSYYSLERPRVSDGMLLVRDKRGGLQGGFRAPYQGRRRGGRQDCDRHTVPGCPAR